MWRSRTTVLQNRDLVQEIISFGSLLELSAMTSINRWWYGMPRLKVCMQREADKIRGYLLRQNGPDDDEPSPMSCCSIPILMRQYIGLCWLSGDACENPDDPDAGRVECSW